MLGVRHLTVKDTTKYFIERRDGKKRYSVGGSYENGWVKTKIRELGTFRIAVDTIAPCVVPVGDSSSRARIIYKVSDIGTGIKSYRGTVDGKFKAKIRPVTTADKSLIVIVFFMKYS